MSNDGVTAIQLLVVCDESATLVGSLERLIGSRAAVGSARRGEAFDAYVALRPHGVIFDVPSDRRTAFDALQTLLALRAQLGNTPVLVLSRITLTAELADGLYVLMKPYSLASLRAAVEPLLVQS